VLAASIISTSETLVNFYQTTRSNIPEHNHLHPRCRENLKSHQAYLVFMKFTAFQVLSDILCFHGGEAVDRDLPGCDAM
jgi:hypothetical protein